MKIRRCLKCMHPLGDGEDICPACGRSYGQWKTEPFALKPGTILDGKYLVGEMLGQGGFGITYLGFDLLLEQRVAIKEYFPMSTGMVTRDGQSAVVWSTAMMGKSGKERGFDSFLKEARKMAKLGGIPGVVGVKSVFIENETAYIVMDYIEGETLQKKLEREGPMDFDTCTRLLMPIMNSLAQVHSHGIIHRDISPDNIMVQPNGELILLDLGAAKELDFRKPDGTLQSSQLVAKHGFSPFEQYTRTGKLGPWTDVYAMAATIYYCCTGSVPPPAVDRIVEDSLTCRPRLTEDQFQALAQGIAVQVDDRLPDMATLIRTLRAKHPIFHRLRSIFQALSRKKLPKKKGKLKWVILGIVVLFLLLPSGEDEDDAQKEITAPIAISAQDVPVDISTRVTEAEETLSFAIPEETTLATVSEESIYAEAVDTYEGGEYDKAKTLFSQIPDYKESRNYLRLLRIRGYGSNIGIGAVYDFKKGLTEAQKKDIDAAAENFDFADTARVMVWNVDVATYFLFGDWYTDDGMYLKWQTDSVGGYGYTRSNKLSTAISNTVSIEDGCFRVDIQSANTPVFQITLSGRDTMHLYCYEYKTRYTLRRK